ncbi:hypothetical protein EAH89_07685 [Roseomonas nepalensis]|uniref:Uncharacterized protein n=1 Tax=Muricoccus nepalensis TaxID=1854500 RepID=A0A502G900_9PROT|nr:hypothetical protein EAH89_07685 [Roseomonas nepalensis]
MLGARGGRGGGGGCGDRGVRHAGADLSEGARRRHGAAPPLATKGAAPEAPPAGFSRASSGLLAAGLSRW